jgi:hypothetical protein
MMFGFRRTFFLYVSIFWAPIVQNWEINIFEQIKLGTFSQCLGQLQLNELFSNNEDRAMYSYSTADRFGFFNICLWSW